MIIRKYILIFLSTTFVLFSLDAVQEKNQLKKKYTALSKKQQSQVQQFSVKEQDKHDKKQKLKKKNYKRLSEEEGRW